MSQEWQQLTGAELEDRQDLISDQLATIFRHLGAQAPDPEAPLEAIFTHQTTGSLLYAIGGAFYAFRDGAGVRYRPVGGGLIEMTARRDEELVGSAVVPERSVFPGGRPVAG